MAQAPIQAPRLFQSPGTSFPGQTRAGVSDGSNTFAAQQFVTISGVGSSAVLAKTADAAVAAYGLTPDASHTATDEPYSAPFGEIHNPIALAGQLFVVNVMDSNKAVGTGSITAGSLVVGQQFGIGTFGTSGYTNIQGLNYSETSLKFFQIEQILPEDANGDLNGRVVVSVLPADIQ